MPPQGLGPSAAHREGRLADLGGLGGGIAQGVGLALAVPGNTSWLVDGQGRALSAAAGLTRNGVTRVVTVTIDGLRSPN